MAFDTPHSALVGALEAQRAAKWGETGELKVRMALHTGALDIFRELGGTRGTAKALADLAFHAFDADELSRAQDLIEEASLLATSLRDPASSRTSNTSAACWPRRVGVNAAVLGRFAEAHTHLRECLLVGIDLGNRWGASYPLDAFAFLALAQRQDERAARLFGAAEAHRTRSGVVPSIADHPALRAIRAAAPDFTGPASAAAHEAGRALDLDAAIALATQPPQSEV